MKKEKLPRLPHSGPVHAPGISSPSRPSVDSGFLTPWERLKPWIYGSIFLFLGSTAWTSFNGAGVGCWPSKKFMVRQIGHFYGHDLNYGLFDVSGICYVKDGKIALWDSGKQRVLLFNFDGNLIDSWNKNASDKQNRTSGKAGLNANENIYNLNVQDIFNNGLPSNRALDRRTNRFYVADYDHWRVNVTDSSGKIQDSILLKDRPMALALDGNGRLFVSYANHYFIQVFSTSGKFLGDVKVQNPDPDLTYWDVRSLFVTENNLLVAADRYAVWVYQIISK